MPYQRSKDEILDDTPPDVVYEHDKGNPCRRCWNYHGSKNRYGCVKCEARVQYLESVDLKLPLTFNRDLHVLRDYL